MEKYAGQPFALVGINADADLETMQQTLEKKPLPWPTIWDGAGGSLASTLGVRAFPTLVLLDGEGKVRRTWTGMPHPSELELVIEGLLAEKR